MAFAVGDLITGNVVNHYGYTTRGAICEVIDTFDTDLCSLDIRVKIVGIDPDLLDDSKSNIIIGYILDVIKRGSTFDVDSRKFELYKWCVHSTKKMSAEQLNDFLNEM